MLTEEHIKLFNESEKFKKTSRNCGRPKARASMILGTEKMTRFHKKASHVDD